MPLPSISFSFQSNQESKTVPIHYVYCIGYTGRNQEKVQAHVEELAELGVPRPNNIPALYPMRLSSLTTAEEIQVSGAETSGEAEIALIFSNDELFVTIGSDHTDRELETVDIGKSKQVCDKPIAKEAWPIDEVLTHWDELTLSTEILIDGEWQPYQNDKFSAILSFDNIVEMLQKRSISIKKAVFFAGTVPLLDGFKFGQAYKMVLSDPVLNRTIELEYKVKDLTAEKNEVKNS
ncbi:DUF2848 family protein [Alteribacillus sp. JSM 102045]|uniref:DUF2848 family protein n=1 Tax=Alteribacillus sp. JSM 102045 TaxID=1562101 RepID=UPI0035C1AE21